MDTLTKHKWETCTSIDPHSWGYSKATKKSEYKTGNEIVDMLVDIVSKNGNLLLNVGPKSDGTIPQLMKDRLRDVGEWLDVNGEAIYGTTYWKTFGEEDVRFTKKDDNTLYAIALTWPEEALNIEAFGELDESQIKSVSLLGSDEKIDWSVSSSGMTIQPPEEKPCEHAFAFKVKLK
jgi:alpha-L-fucosidase